MYLPGEAILLDTMQSVRHGLHEVVYYPNPTQMAIMISSITPRAPMRKIRLDSIRFAQTQSVRTPMGRVHESQGLKRWTVPTRPKDHDS
jgi:hypothetical protein